MARTEQRPAEARKKTSDSKKTAAAIDREEVIADYRLAFQSRVASLIGRKEVLNGRAKFGIFGDGKEVAQLAMAKVYRPGDWRSGYYRDQTFMFATGMSNFREFFAQLYADTNIEHDPATGGRQMGSHWSSRFIDEEGNFKRQVDEMHTSADLSPTAGQMARLLGLAYASKLYRQLPELKEVSEDFSHNGDEVAFGTIGNASAAEGIAFETINAAGVLGVPMVLSVWDDGYGISVPNEFQVIKSSISEALSGFAREGDSNGFEIYVVKGWDYIELRKTYATAVEKSRKDHIPALIHVTEMTQPQGHSTSGSHERYKSKERLDWESEHDALTKMKQWMLDEDIATEDEFAAWEQEDRDSVESERKSALAAYMEPLKKEQADVLELLSAAAQDSGDRSELEEIIAGLKEPAELNRKLIQSSIVHSLIVLRGSDSSSRERLVDYLENYRKENNRRYNSFLYSGSNDSPINVKEVKPTYSDDSEMVDGRVVLVRNFDENFTRDPRIFSIGEDVGKLGDTDHVFEGLQAKHGEWRLTDTGIREATILGQGIGAAMRGLRPLVDIQYLDYLLYALQGMSDDLATLHYRSAGGQKAPVIIRTKGHRLQGIWHTGSPMGMILHSCRGIYVCVPRDMTRAAGMYNTLLQGDNPALVVEVLSGYRLKERVPDNVGTFTVPLGVPEIMRQGTDLTVVTYGANVRIALEAAEKLAELDIDIEVIDVQTLSPFDIDGVIAESLRKTNALLSLDEDVPGGASAYMLQEILERQQGWENLDAPPRTLSASANRSAYATDGQYFTKPNVETIMETVYQIMRERSPEDYPPIGGTEDVSGTPYE